MSVTTSKELELEFGYVFGLPLSYTKFTYVDKQLTALEIFEDNTETTKLFQKDFTYTGKLLTKLVITRTSDGVILTKDLAYIGKDLANITRS